MKTKGKYYFLSKWNYVDLLGLLLNTLILASQLFVSKISPKLTLYAAFIAIALMWAQFIYWFRVFERTTLYIRLIRQTIIDILDFGFIFLLVLLAAANLMFLLNINRNQTEENDELFDQWFSNKFMSALLNTYLTSLGEFGFDNYSRETPNSYVAWTLFIFVTLFSQITILNMLIAIMADTFDRVFENKQAAILKLKVETMSDFAFLMESDEDREQFLFICTPKIKEVDE